MAWSHGQVLQPHQAQQVERSPDQSSNSTAAGRRSQLRARRSLLWCVGAFCLAPVAGGWLVDHCPVEIRFGEAAEIIHAWEQADPSPDVLLLGSSRFRACIINQQLAATTNKLLGKDSPAILNGSVTGGEAITMDFLSRQLFAHRNIRPRLAILEASPDLLARDNLHFKMIIGRQLTAADLPRYGLDMLLSGTHSRLFASRVTPFYLHRGQLLAWFTQTGRQVIGNKAPPVASDTGPKQPPPPTQEWVCSTLHRFERNLQHYQLSGATAAAYVDLIARLHAIGCKTILVEPPLTSAHRKIFSPKVRDTFAGFVSRLNQTYGCEFLDFSQRFSDSYFYDTHHVNDEGRIKSTDLFAEEVIAPAWHQILSSRSADTDQKLRPIAPGQPDVHRRLY